MMADPLAEGRAFAERMRSKGRSDEQIIAALHQAG